jgi:hypothetical protein
MASKYLEFAEVRRDKDDSSKTYIVFTADLEVKAKDYKGVENTYKFKKGQTIYKDTPQEKIENLVNNGYLDEQKAQERIEKIPDYILQILTAKSQD